MPPSEPDHEADFFAEGLLAEPHEMWFHPTADLILAPRKANERRRRRLHLEDHQPKG